MTDYRNAYEYYKDACQKHDLDPVNFHYFILNLSQDQLYAYDEYVNEKRGNYEPTN